jgi:hypothetical protein
MGARLRLPCLLAAAALAAGTVQAACGAVDWDWQAGATHSLWHEHTEAGRRLVHERGTLGTLAGEAAAVCSGLRWEAQLGLAEGRRGYQGESSAGQPIATHSRIRRLQGQVALLLPVPALGPGWHTGAALGHVRLWRDIASVGAVLGYPERFDQWQASAVVDHRRALQPGLGLQARLALGGGPAGRLLLHLPSADAARLRLGTSRMVQLEVTLLGGGLAAPAGWHAGLHWRHQRTAAGPSATLWRGTLPVGAAAQPAVRQTDLGLQAGWRW